MTSIPAGLTIRCGGLISPPALAATAALGSNSPMHVVFAHHEPVDPRRARWVAIVRTLAAVAERVPLTWLSPDSRARIDDFAGADLGLTLPEALTVRTLPSVHRRFGLTLNSVFFGAFRKAVSESGAEILWLRSDKLAAHAAHRRIAQPLVYEAHLVGELWSQDRNAGDRRALRAAELERQIYGHAAGVAAISKGLLDEIGSRFDYRGPTAVVPSAVDTSIFRSSWQGGDGRTVVWVGTLQFWKGLNTLLEAIVAAPSLRLRLVGGGKADEEHRLREEINRLGLSDRVELTGRVVQKDIPLHVKSAACAVHPLPPEHSISSRFTSPLKLFEYMALGLPIVAADVPSAREILRDGDNSCLFRAGDPESLARSLERVCMDRALATKLSDRAVKDAADYTYSRRADRLIELFERVRNQAAV